MPAGSKPGGTRCEPREAADDQRRRRPAAPPPARARRRPAARRRPCPRRHTAPVPLAPRPASFRSRVRSRRDSRNAGARPNSRPDAIERHGGEQRARAPSRPISSRRGTLPRPSAWMPCDAGRRRRATPSSAAGAGQQQRLGQQLPHEAAGAGADRGAHGHLAPAAEGARRAAGWRRWRRRRAARSRPRRRGSTSGRRTSPTTCSCSGTTPNVSPPLAG